jgi:sugar phosphate isomerase/epimerase
MPKLTKPVNIRLATADYSFPLLKWHKALRLAQDLGFAGIDLSLFEGRSHLKPAEVLALPRQAGVEARNAVHGAGLAVADIFGIPGTTFADLCPNHPELSVRQKARDYFQKILEFAVACESHHLSILPGVTFEDESFDLSLSRCAEELAWRCEKAADAKVEFSVEAHVGSIIQKPASAARLLAMAPALTLTLDLGHFVVQGIAQKEADQLLARASHVHMRCANPTRLQTSLQNNAIDFADLVKKLTAQAYSGWYAVEYVWIDWEHCNEVDNLSETILLRDLLQSIGEQLA